jgi:hypothetical protein
MTQQDDAQDHKAIVQYNDLAQQGLGAKAAQVRFAEMVGGEEHEQRSTEQGEQVEQDPEQQQAAEVSSEEQWSVKGSAIITRLLGGDQQVGRTVRNANQHDAQEEQTHLQFRGEDLQHLVRQQKGTTEKQ